MATYAIGDIHGSLAALTTLIDVVSPCAEDTVITLGDYVDRGPDSKGCIDYLLDLQSRVELVCLRGNHEVMMMKALESRWEAYRWSGVGGRATLESYDVTKPAKIPDSHWEFVRDTIPYYETETHIFVHAGVDARFSMENQTEWDLYWKRFDDPQPHVSGKTVICGHSAQISGLPLSHGHAICIDTYIYGGGWLTCLDVDSDTYVQANQKGAIRRDVLEKRELDSE